VKSTGLAIRFGLSETVAFDTVHTVLPVPDGRAIFVVHASRAVMG